MPKMRLEKQGIQWNFCKQGLRAKQRGLKIMEVNKNGR